MTKRHRGSTTPRSPSPRPPTKSALATAERERDRWAGARETVLALAAEELGCPAALTRTPVTPAYPQIIKAFAKATGPLRAEDLCQVLDTDTDARHVEGMRSKLKKLVARGILIEPDAGTFAPATAPDGSRGA